MHWSHLQVYHSLVFSSPEVPADLLAADGPELLLPRRHRHVLLKDLLLGVLTSLSNRFRKHWL